MTRAGAAKKSLVRSSSSIEHEASRRHDGLEFEEQARFANSGLRHCGDDLPAPALREFERALHLRELGAAAHELREPAPRLRL
jgi:hypothetical protein